MIYLYLLIYCEFWYEDSVRDRGTKGETWQNGKWLRWGLLLCVYACFVLSADILKTQAWNSYESINASFRVSNALSVFGLVISVNIPLHLNPSFFNSLTSPTRYKVNHKSDTIIFFVGVISILNISCCCYVFRYLCYRVSLY